MKNASPARACGIDFGTSNSTVGWLRPGMETLIALEDDKITLPSVVFFNIEERRPVFGRLALHEYLEGYEGRLMRSLKSLLGSKLIKHDTSVLGTAMASAARSLSRVASSARPVLARRTPWATTTARARNARHR